MRIASKKSDHAILHMNCDTVAILVLLRRCDDWPQRNILELADPSEQIAHLLPFYRKLMLVIDVLVCASAALAKIRTDRCDAMRRVLLNFHQLRLGKLFFLPHDLGGNCFTVDRIRDKDSLALFTSDAFSAESDVFDF